jgi:hypothetical protein
MWRLKYVKRVVVYGYETYSFKWKKTEIDGFLEESVKE